MSAYLTHIPASASRGAVELKISRMCGNHSYLRHQRTETGTSGFHLASDLRDPKASGGESADADPLADLQAE